MKLLRYGPRGQEKPGLVDRDGRLRDLSGAIRDIDGAALAPAELDRLRRLNPASLPLVPGTPRLGLASLRRDAALLGGRLDIDAAPGRPVSVLLAFPAGQDA